MFGGKELTGDNNSNSTNQFLRKQRICGFFLDAANTIAREKGLNGITIRNVAKLAGYNSATLYNYFNNVEQLIDLTAIHMVQPWIRSGSKIFLQYDDPLDRYVGGWRSFCEYAFRDPEGFVHIYCDKPEGIAESFQLYKELFGNDAESIYYDIYEQSSLRAQEEVSIRPCIDAGYFSQEDASDVYELGLLLIDGLLGRVHRTGKTDQAEEYTEMFMKYFVDFLSRRLLKPRDLSCFL